MTATYRKKHKLVTPLLHLYRPNLMNCPTNPSMTVAAWPSIVLLVSRQEKSARNSV